MCSASKQNIISWHMQKYCSNFSHRHYDIVAWIQDIHVPGTAVPLSSSLEKQIALWEMVIKVKYDTMHSCFNFPLVVIWVTKPSKDKM